jgi:cytochrome c
VRSPALLRFAKRPERGYEPIEDVVLTLIGKRRQVARMIDSFEFSKIAGGVLAALLLIFAPKTFIDIMRQSHHGEIKNGFTLPAATEAAAPSPGGGAAAPAAFDPAQVAAAVATASPEEGAAAFKKCAACHSFEKGAASKAGPNLWGVLGRPHGSFPGFAYSEAMKSKGGDWTYSDLAQFIHKPKEFVPGTKMIFAGVADTGELASIIAYIRTLSDNPQPLPEAAPPPAAQPEAAPAEAPAQPEAPKPAP